METWIRDLKYAARTLARNPGFTAVVVLTLALGIGANTAMFSVINAVVLKPLPVLNPHELANLYTWRADEFLANQPSSFSDFNYYGANNRVFSGLAAYALAPASLGDGREASMIMGETVSGNYFEVLGVAPVLGRFFRPEEDVTKGEHPVVVISSALWSVRFGSDPDITGSGVRLNGYPYTVIGVAPESFSGGMRGFASDFWIPLMMVEQLNPGTTRLDSRENRWLFIVGRLKAGVDIDPARADVKTLAAQLSLDDPNAEETDTATLVPTNNVVFLPDADNAIFAVSGLLMALVGTVLLIACANVANLLLARSIARRKEIAVRMSMGASRWRLVRQMLTESLLLSLMAGVVAFVFARWSAGFIVGLLTQVPLPLDIRLALDLGIDWRILGFSLMVSVVTAVLFGLVPALESSRVDLIGSLKDTAGAVTSDRKRFRLRGALVVSQVALSLLLLISAGLFLRSLLNVHTTDPGFETDGVFTAQLLPMLRGYDDERATQFYEALLDRVRTLPGVEAASLVTHLPLNLSIRTSSALPEGQPVVPQRDFPSIDNTNVWPGYFRTMGIAVLSGRDFEARDTPDSPDVMIVNQALVERYWPGEDPIGKIIRTGREGGDRYRVVGVVSNGRYRTLGEDPRPFMYRSLIQMNEGIADLLVLAPGASASFLGTLREEVLAIDADVPVTNMAMLEDRLSLTLLLPRMGALLFGVIGVIGLILAATGILGVMSYAVGQRTQEIGIRVALGAGPRIILGLIVGHGLLLTGVGVGLGTVAAFGLTRFMSALLVGVSPSDPITFLGVVLLLVGVAAIACYVPARRALSVDPMDALRSE